ncbi:penicillin acylase family protein [Bacillus sp. AC79A.1]
MWYQTRLEMKDLNVSGVIFAGVPGVILGHNDKIAWGVTNTGLMCKIYILRREILIMKMNFCITINGRKLRS